MKLRQYQSGDKELWDKFVRTARNATFLFERAYMDYHADRFVDASLLAFDEKSRLRAVFPATWHEPSSEIRSHGGLTYGGLLLSPKVGLAETCETMRAICNFYASHYSAHRLVISLVPAIYHRSPAEDVAFAVRACGGQLCQQDAATVVDLRENLAFSQLRKRGANKAVKQGYRVKSGETDVDKFWLLLADTLATRHNTQPVHTAAELKLLASRFPENITSHVVEDAAGNWQGATLLYHTPRVVHAQYIASSEEGRKHGALDLLFIELLQHFQQMPSESRPTYFDFGTSMLNRGSEISEGLVAQKEGFGGHTVCYDKYCINLS